MVESTGLENRRPFTRSKGSNPFPSATFSLLSSSDSMLVVHSWSISVDLRDQSRNLSEPFRYFSLARRGISELRERPAKIEIADLAGSSHRS